MTRKCAVFTCTSEEGRPADRGVTFHKIPSHPDVRLKWMSLCRIPEHKHASKGLQVCSRHFLKADFCKFKGERYMLKRGVLPSAFPWSPAPKRVPSTSQVKPAATTKDGVKKEKVKDTIRPKQERLSNSPPPLQEQPPALSAPIKFEPSMTIEALDFKGSWNVAQVVEVDYEENEILVHYDNNPSKYDEWISMTSKRLRPIEGAVKLEIKEEPPWSIEAQILPESTLSPGGIGAEAIDGHTFIEGERCLASWIDSRKFPATVTKVIDSENYEVLFDDGFVKIQKARRMVKVKDGKQLGQSPLFDPVKGTKQERRDKKRKLNVAQLFGKQPRSKQLKPDQRPSTVEDVVGAADARSPKRSSPVQQVESPVSAEATSAEPWMPIWENGRPVGTPSTIATNVGPKDSIIVDDPRLPPGYEKHFVRRKSGTAMGKWDTMVRGPDGKRFRSRCDVRNYIRDNPHLDLKESQFDFALHNRGNLHRRSAPRQRKSADSPRISEPPPLPRPDTPSTPIREEETASPNLLKIPLVDDAYKCPIDGCDKNFRRENLAQMHVKHYHPEFTKFLDWTPNVADLAYARTVGDSLEGSPSTPERPPKPPQPKQAKPSTPKPAVQTPPPELSKQSPASGASPKAPVSPTKDSEILKLLTAKSGEEEKVLQYPPGLPSNMYPEIKLKDLLNKSEGVPANWPDMSLKQLGASTARPSGIRTLLPVVRTGDGKKESTATSPVPVSDSPNEGETAAGASKSSKRKRPAAPPPPPPPMEVPPELPAVELPPPPPPPSIEQQRRSGFIVEGGEVIKIVQMKREEIINCTCGITEEDGLMIQCEVCFCWQHAYCNNIFRENEVPEKYICYICQHPTGQRTSRKYHHDQDWLKNGTLPVGSYRCKDEEKLKKRFEALKKSHDLSGGLIELTDYIQSLRVKMKIAEAENHPKLYLWSKPWQKRPLPEKTEVKTEFQEPDDELPEFPTLNSLMDEQMPKVPQPEAVIDSADCKLNLLDHIAHSQSLVEERLNNFEAEIDVLDGGAGQDSEEDFVRTKQTMQMLLRDLAALRELSQGSYL